MGVANRMSQKRKTKKKSKNTYKTKRKSPTRGWKKVSPKSGSQRRAMLKKCGKKCFLSPSNLKFPICRSNCVQDCRAIAAAKSRASQYKYAKVAARASVLYNRKCK